MQYIDIIFDGPPDNESGRFLEVENHLGLSISAGEWIEREDGLWALRIQQKHPSFDGNFAQHLAYQIKYMRGVFMGKIDELRLKAYGEDFVDQVAMDRLVDMTSKVIHALIDEAREIHRETPWKFWKDYGVDRIPNVEAIRYEIIDAQHFLNVLIMLWFDGDVELFHKMFAKKLEENVRRQEEGY